MIDIMKDQHKLVPGTKESNQLKKVFIGDLLTVERAQNVQRNLQDANSP